MRTLTAVLCALLLGASAGCGSVAGPRTASSLTVPEVFYLPPHGDRSGPVGKVPFHLQATDGRVPDNTGPVDHTLTIDLRDAGGAVRLWIKSGHACEGTDTHVVCRLQGRYDSWVEPDRVYPTATKKGRPGDSAGVDYSFAAKDGRKVTGHTRVVVGEPVPELLVADPVTDVRPDAAVSVPVAVRNTGEVPVRGLGLLVHAGDSGFRQRHSNCRYPPQMNGREAVCIFPGLRIAPGETVVVRPALALRTGRTLIFSSVSEEAWPLDVGPAKYSAVPDDGDAGDGPELVATAASKGPAGPYKGGAISVPVTLDLHADHRVDASELHTGKGRELRLTVTDDGPGDPGSGGRLLFTPPPGAVVREQPMEEIDEDVHEPACRLAGGTYDCPVGHLGPGRSVSLDFTLDLPEPGTGQVSFRMKELETDGRDPDLGDNSAPVIVLP